MTVTDATETVVADEAGETAPASKRAYRGWPLKAVVIAVDAAAIALGMTAAFLISRHFQPFDRRPATNVCLWVGAVSMPVWVGVFLRYRLYAARFTAARVDEFRRLLHASLTSTLGMAAVSFLFKQPVSRGWLILCFPCALVACWLEREVVRETFKRARQRGHLLRRVILVGANAEAKSLVQMFEVSPWLGYRVIGIVDDSDERHLLDQPVLGRPGDTLDIVRATGASGVIVATTSVTEASSNRLVRQLVEAGVHVELSLSLQDIGSERLTVRPLGTCPVVYVEPAHRDGWRAFAKRSFDVTCSAAGLVLLSPILALVALAVKLDSSGPVFFSQVRAGKDGRPFPVHKFRTMVPNAEELLADLRERNEVAWPLFKLRNDPRVTRVGRLLRRFSIDEIPQLWNVLSGEMSLVGPRPALYSEMDGWGPELRSRLRVRPGLTGMWQVSGRNDLSFSDYIRLDLYYVDNWSLWRDVAIVAKTIPVILTKHGAY